MSSPNFVSTAELQGEDVVVIGKPTGQNGLPGLEIPFKARAYQLEMLEESMRRNIILSVLLPSSLISSAADIL